mmetsp:Transcript_134252/g.237568  ORF Transcript_134252/g.237568 Transcript_134252/m.237568 type:complete len:215 (-) Transcript_134252:137-781(-)
MRSVSLVLACLVFPYHARRMKVASERQQPAASSGELDAAVEKHASHAPMEFQGESKDAEELFSEAAAEAAVEVKSDPSLLLEMAQEMRLPRDLAQLIKMMADASFQKQAKHVAQQMRLWKVVSVILTLVFARSLSLLVMFQLMMVATKKHSVLWHSKLIECLALFLTRCFAKSRMKRCSQSKSQAAILEVLFESTPSGTGLSYAHTDVTPLPSL